ERSGTRAGRSAIPSESSFQPELRLGNLGPGRALPPAIHLALPRPDAERVRGLDQPQTLVQQATPGFERPEVGTGQSRRHLATQVTERFVAPPGHVEDVA